MNKWIDELLNSIRQTTAQMSFAQAVVRRMGTKGL